MVRQLATRLGDKLSVNAIAIGDEESAWLKRLVDLVSASHLSVTVQTVTLEGVSTVHNMLTTVSRACSQ